MHKLVKFATEFTDADVIERKQQPATVELR